MPDEIERSLLERLQALRGADSAAVPRHELKIDLVERTKPPTKEDALAARLRSLRDQDGTSKISPKPPQPQCEKTPRSPPEPPALATSSSEKPVNQSGENAEDGDDVDAMLQTDGSLLEEMLAHITVEDDEPRAQQVRAFLDEIAKGIPPGGEEEGEDEEDEEISDSDSGQADRKADDLIARFRDEIELEAALHPDGQSEDEGADAQEDLRTDTQNEDEGAQSPEIPSLPENLDPLPPSSSSLFSSSAALTDMDDITARLALLRVPGTSTGTPLPSVPSSAPAAKRLTRTTTAYTDDDADGWCTVCLEDATLQCPACDGDVYCARCWREMHVGPAAAFDDRSHRAVYFTRDKGKPRHVALGA